MTDNQGVIMKKAIILLAAAILLCVSSASGQFVEKTEVYAEKDSGDKATQATGMQTDSPSSTPAFTPVPTATPVPSPTPVPTPIPANITICAVGDIMLGRGVGSRLEEQGKSVEYPFEKVRDMLRTGDIVFCNIEHPITDSTHCLDRSRKIILGCATKYMESINNAGFNMVNLANNHIMDFYGEGLMDTIALLDENGIVHAGAGAGMEEARKPALMQVNGMKAGMLAYTNYAELVFAGDPYFKFEAEEDKPGVAPRKLEYILEDMENLREHVDLLIVSLHWGIEESFNISTEQVEFAHKIIDSGADIILGHHPHQFQGMEIYKGKPIIYSMGNFIFDQNDPENQEAFILVFEYEEVILKELRAVPVRTENKTQVVFQKGSEAQNILKREQELCKALGTDFVIDGDMLVYRAQKNLQEEK